MSNPTNRRHLHKPHRFGSLALPLDIPGWEIKRATAISLPRKRPVAKRVSVRLNPSRRDPSFHPTVGTARALSHKSDPWWIVGTSTTRTCGHTAPYQPTNLHQGSESLWASVWYKTKGTFGYKFRSE